MRIPWEGKAQALPAHEEPKALPTHEEETLASSPSKGRGGPPTNWPKDVPFDVVQDVLQGKKPLGALSKEQARQAATFYRDSASKVKGSKAKLARAFNLERASASSPDLLGKKERAGMQASQACLPRTRQGASPPAPPLPNRSLDSALGFLKKEAQHPQGKSQILRLGLKVGSEEEVAKSQKTRRKVRVVVEAGLAVRSLTFAK